MAAVVFLTFFLAECYKKHPFMHEEDVKQVDATHGWNWTAPRKCMDSCHLYDDDFRLCSNASGCMWCDTSVTYSWINEGHYKVCTDWRHSLGRTRLAALQPHTCHSLPLFVSPDTILPYGIVCQDINVQEYTQSDPDDLARHICAVAGTPCKPQFGLRPAICPAYESMRYSLPFNYFYGDAKRDCVDTCSIDGYPCCLPLDIESGKQCAEGKGLCRGGWCYPMDDRSNM